MQYVIFWLSFAISILGIAISLIRQYRLKQLRQYIQQTYPIQQVSQKDELAAMAGLSTVELCWHWASIDTQVIDAADFSSTQDIQSGFEFAQYIHQHVSNMDTESLIGFKRRLMGYVGEQNVADLLIEQGHVVEVAQTANQPVWDLLVDGEKVNVKTVQDIASIKAQALAYPDTIYLVPEDAIGEANGNIVRLDGFNHEQLQNLTDQTVDNSVDATDAVINIAGHLPVVPLLFSIMRNRKAIEQGRDNDVAVQHVILDTLGRGGGAGLGAVIGGTIGTIAGPIGTVIGSALGAIVGGMFGQNIVEEIKQQPLQKALQKFEQQLQKFGAVYANRLQRIVHLLQQPYIRQQQALQRLNQQFELRKKQWKWWIFPDFYSVLLEQTLIYAQQQIDKQKMILARIETQLTDAHVQQDYRPLGLIILNIPHMREILGTDLIALRHINEQRERVYYERNQLYPEQFPLKEQKIL
ncbi:MAG: glycine zipper domain-containing protein [Christensenellaceae bacterium]